MTSDARNLWHWVTTCVDDTDQWCPPGKTTGPSYDVRVTNEVWKEVQSIHDMQTVQLDGQYYYRLLDGQIKGDGRGAQGNVQLFRSAGRTLCMNLHVPLYRNEVIVTAATDGGGDWFTPQTNKFKKKQKPG